MCVDRRFEDAKSWSSRCEKRGEMGGGSGFDWLARLGAGTAMSAGRAWVAGCFLANLLLAGCFYPDTSPNPIPAKAANKGPEEFDPRVETLKAMDLVKGGYRRKMIMESEERRDKNQRAMRIEAQAEMACPGRSHYQQTNNGRLGYDNYYIEGMMTYLSLGRYVQNQGNWRVAPGCPGDEHGNNFGPGGTNFMLSGKDYLNLVRFTPELTQLKFIKAGTDTVEYMPCQHWVTSFKGNFDLKYDVDYCLGMSDDLPYRLVVTSPGSRIELTYWDWNSDRIYVMAPN